MNPITVGTASSLGSNLIALIFILVGGIGIIIYLTLELLEYIKSRKK